MPATVMVLYASILSVTIPGAMGHILTASIISAPAAIMIGTVMVPETRPLTPGVLTPPEPATSTMDALTKGTLQGVTLLINVVAMRPVLLACVYLVNLLLTFGPTVAGALLSLQRLLGGLMAPVAFIMGVLLDETAAAGSLMGRGFE